MCELSVEGDKVDLKHRKYVQSLQAVDELVEAVMQELHARHLLRSTYTIYTSDNGEAVGRHRLSFHKSVIYEEAVRVPLLISGPAVPFQPLVE